MKFFNKGGTKNNFSICGQVKEGLFLHHSKKIYFFILIDFYENWQLFVPHSFYFYPFLYKRFYTIFLNDSYNSY